MRPGRAHDPTQASEQRESERKRDRALVAAVRNGCVDAWQTFVAGYTNLILTALRQVLFLEDDDEIYEVYVDLLEDLRDHKLGQYEGSASLSTWLVLVARGYGLDHLRSKRGRPRPPVGYERLSEREKLVYRWRFCEGVSLNVVLELLNWGGDKVGIEDLVGAIQRIEEVIDPRTLTRLDRERVAHNAGHGSWRELQRVLHMRLEYTRRSEDDGDSVTAGLETDEMHRRLAAVRETLRPEEREIVDLRFVEGLSAREISKRVGWASTRRVYSVIESALGRLRRGLAGPAREKKDMGT